MTATVIAPVVPPTHAGHTTSGADRSALARAPLPLPDLPPQRTSAVVYAAAIDDRGRVGDGVVLRALGWVAGHRLTIQEAAGTLTVIPDPTGDREVTGLGHLRISAVLRHRCALATGDRVLLAADPDRSCLAIYPPLIGHSRSRSARRRAPDEPTPPVPTRYQQGHRRGDLGTTGPGGQAAGSSQQRGLIMIAML